MGPKPQFLLRPFDHSLIQLSWGTFDLPSTVLTKVSKTLMALPSRETGVQTDKAAGVPGGEREGPLRPEEAEFSGEGCRSMGRRGFSTVFKTFFFYLQK